MDSREQQELSTDPGSSPGPVRSTGAQGRLLWEPGSRARAANGSLKVGERRSWSRLLRHKLEAGVALSSSPSFFPPREVSFVQIARPCQLGRDLTRETWSLPRFSCERMPLLFPSKE